MVARWRRSRAGEPKERAIEAGKVAQEPCWRGGADVGRVTGGSGSDQPAVGGEAKQFVRDPDVRRISYLPRPAGPGAASAAPVDPRTLTVHPQDRGSHTPHTLRSTEKPAAVVSQPARYLTRVVCVCGVWEPMRPPMARGTNGGECRGPRRPRNLSSHPPNQRQGHTRDTR